MVAAFLYNTPAFVFSLLAAARVGAVFNPINYRLAAQELAFILEDGQAKVLLFEKEGSEVVEKAREHGVPTAHWIYADSDAAPAFATARLDQLVRHQPATLPPVIVEENDNCILMYTSGTTGRPKGVLHTHRSKLAHNAMMHQAMTLSPGGRGPGGGAPEPHRRTAHQLPAPACSWAPPRCCCAASTPARPGA